MHIARLPDLAVGLFALLQRRVAQVREPDFIIGADDPDGAYLRRWWVIPRNRLLNIYLHEFRRDDDDRALHDHPWWSLSFMLQGSYIEHTIQAGGLHRRQRFDAGALRFLRARHAHRVELHDAPEQPEMPIGASPERWRMRVKAPCWTLFITGPTLREWGFHCPDAGWIPWQKFTAANNKGEIGPGCGA